MKYIQKIALLLIILGVVMTIYQLLTGDDNKNFTKNTGFYIFIVGLLISSIYQFLIKKKE